MIEEVVKEVAPHLISPMAVVALGYIIKSKLGKIDQVTAILIKIQNIESTILEMKMRLNESLKHREEFIVLKSEVKSQWIRVDELKEQVRELSV